MMTGEEGLEETEEDDGCEDISTQDSDDGTSAWMKALNNIEASLMPHTFIEKPLRSSY